MGHVPSGPARQAGRRAVEWHAPNSHRLAFPTSTVSTTRLPYLVVAVTGRALAASAIRAGHRVVVLDCFADRDTAALARACRSVVAPTRLRIDRIALLKAATDLAPVGRCAGVVYGSGFEGRTALLASLGQGRRICGNTPSVIDEVREPGCFFGLLDRLAIRHPEVRLTPPPSPSGWLVKRAGGAGGAQVRPASGGPAPAGGYFQRFEPGRVLSAIFLADGRRARILGINQQWTSGARPRLPFLYGGAVGGFVLPPSVRSDVAARVDALVAATGLVGLNGIDFLLRGVEWSLLELNPRPTATVELYDRDYPRGLFEWHLRACEGQLPAGPARPRATRAHAVVHAATAGRVSRGFDFPAWCRDVPRPGTTYSPGDPLCTVHAAARTAGAALALLGRRKRRLEEALLEAVP